MQPLLLVKQTLEVGYDPGPLLLQGPNVSFGRVAEMLWRGKAKDDIAKRFSISFVDADGEEAELTFAGGPKGLDLSEMRYKAPATWNKPAYVLKPSLSEAELLQLVDDPLRQITRRRNGSRLDIRRRRCFFEFCLRDPKSQTAVSLGLSRESALLEYFASRLLHLQGLRDLPERLYPATQAGDVFPGPFHPYVASVIAGWCEQNDERWHAVNSDLHILGLTWKVEAQRLDDTTVALRVGRLPHAQRGGARDLVNIADVGLGVSQTLPILVALELAQKDQIVYLEQPEIHLHPRAQIAIAPIILAAAARGAIIVCETHSHLLVRSIQNVVAHDKNVARLIGINWFSRDAEGVTRVASAGLDDAGAYGDLPLDFNEVELALENDYLDAVQSAW